MNKHYIRIDSQSRITHGFSDEFEQPQDNDIEINIGMNAGRLFELFVNDEWLTNPPLTDFDGVFLYKWDGKQALQRTDKEMDADRPEPPEQPIFHYSETERIEFVEALMDGMGLEENHSLDSIRQMALSFGEASMQTIEKQRM